MLYDFATTRIGAETLQSCVKPGVDNASAALICDDGSILYLHLWRDALHQDAIEFGIAQLLPVAVLIKPKLSFFWRRHLSKD